MVKGEPKPEVVWKRNNKDIDDPQKYQISFSPATNEFILQVRINYYDTQFGVIISIMPVLAGNIFIFICVLCKLVLYKPLLMRKR